MAFRETDSLHKTWSQSCEIASFEAFGRPRFFWIKRSGKKTWNFFGGFLFLKNSLERGSEENWDVFPWKFRGWGLWGKWMFWKFGNPPALKEHCSWRFLVLLRFLEQPLKLQEKQTSTSHLCGCTRDKKAGSRRWYEDLWRWPKY